MSNTTGTFLKSTIAWYQPSLDRFSVIKRVMNTHKMDVECPRWHALCTWFLYSAYCICEKEAGFRIRLGGNLLQPEAFPKCFVIHFSLGRGEVWLQLQTNVCIKTLSPPTHTLGLYQRQFWCIGCTSYMVFVQLWFQCSLYIASTDRPCWPVYQSLSCAHPMHMVFKKSTK